jgi:hypothetical protein
LFPGASAFGALFLSGFFPGKQQGVSARRAVWQKRKKNMQKNACILLQGMLYYKSRC